MVHLDVKRLSFVQFLYLITSLLCYSANILLDEHRTAKIGDFGFAKEIPRVRAGKSYFNMAMCCGFVGYTVEPPITDPPKGGQPPYIGQSLWHGLISLQL